MINLNNDFSMNFSTFLENQKHVLTQNELPNVNSQDLSSEVNNLSLNEELEGKALPLPHHTTISPTVTTTSSIVPIVIPAKKTSNIFEDFINFIKNLFRKKASTKSTSDSIDVKKNLARKPQFKVKKFPQTPTTEISDISFLRKIKIDALKVALHNNVVNVNDTLQDDTIPCKREAGHLFLNHVIKKLNLKQDILCEYEGMDTSSSLKLMINFLKRIPQQPIQLQAKTKDLIEGMKNTFERMAQFEKFISFAKRKYNLISQAEKFTPELVEVAQKDLNDAKNIFKDKLLEDMKSLKVNEFASYDLGGGSDHSTKFLIKRLPDSENKPQYKLVFFETGFASNQLNKAIKLSNENNPFTFLEISNVSLEGLEKSPVWDLLIEQKLTESSLDISQKVFDELGKLGKPTNFQDGPLVSALTDKVAFQQAVQQGGFCTWKSSLALIRYLMLTELDASNPMLGYEEYKIVSSLIAKLGMEDLSKDSSSLSNELLNLVKIKHGWKKRFLLPSWISYARDSAKFNHDKPLIIKNLKDIIKEIHIKGNMSQGQDYILNKISLLNKSAHPFVILSDLCKLLGDELIRSGISLKELNQIFEKLPEDMKTLFEPARFLYLEEIALKNFQEHAKRDAEIF